MTAALELMSEMESSQRKCHDCKAPAVEGKTRCQKHIDDSLARSAAWRKANPERVREHRQSAYAKNREQIKARSREWSKANRERKAQTTAKWAKENSDRVLNSRLKKFGMSAAEYKDMLSAQGGRCAICGTDKPGGRGRFCVDHDHEAESAGAMVVRGLLCSSCNRGIGFFFDRQESLLAAAAYLAKAREAVKASAHRQEPLE